MTVRYLERRGRTFMLIVAFLMLSHLVLQLWNTQSANLDTAQLFSMGERILDGALPFRDIYDTNTPISMYAHVVPVVLRDYIGLDSVRAIQLSVLMFASVAFALLFVVLRNWELEDGFLLFVVVLASWIYFSVGITRSTEISQREALLLTGMLPYLFARAGVLGGYRQRPSIEIAVAILAVFSLFLKPPHFLTVIAIEAFILLRQRRDRHVFLIPAAMTLMVGLTLLLSPMRLYLFDWSPVFAEYYSAYGSPIRTVMRWLAWTPLFHAQILILVFGAVVIFLLRDRARKSVLFFSLLFAVGGLVVAFLQSKGWGHHYLPFRFAISLTSALALYFLMVSQSRILPNRVAALFVVTLFALLQLMHFPAARQFRPLPTVEPSAPMDVALRRYTVPGDLVLNLSAGIPPAFPAITHSGLRYGGRFFAAWAVPMAYEDQPVQQVRPERAWLADRFYRETCADVRRNAPALLIVDTTRGIYSLPPEMSILTFLEERGFFKSVAAHYRLVDHVEEHRLYVRR